MYLLPAEFGLISCDLGEGMLAAAVDWDWEGCGEQHWCCSGVGGAAAEEGLANTCRGGDEG